MRLVRFGNIGQERPGIWLETDSTRSEPMILDVRKRAFDIHDYDEHFFASGGLERLEVLLKEKNLPLVRADKVRLGPPIGRPSKIVCLGANYLAHVSEFGGQKTEVPVFFSKATTSMCGPFDPIAIPVDSVVDSEVELAFVIKKKACCVPESQALNYVAGYLILNDVTDRKAQKAASQWFYAKSYDTFCPMGPYLVTCNEIANPQGLRLLSKVNGKTLQSGSTAEMIHNIASIVAYLTKRITLLPGDVVSTGTPAGIGSAQRPPVVLKSGDIVELEIDQLGSQKNPVIGAEDKVQ